MISSLIATLTLAVVGQTAQVPPDRAPTVPSLTVTGNAEVRVNPDLAIVRIGVVAQARTAQAAQNDVNRRVQEFLGRARTLLKDKGTIETGRIVLHPVYSEPPRQPNQAYTPQISGYRAENILEARLTDFTLVGPLIDTALEAGLNNVESVTFGLRDDTEARLQALREAVRQATRKAQAVAEAAGVQTEGVWEISENSARVMPYMARAEMAMGGNVATPVIPGSVTVNADVVMRFFIRRGQ